MHTYEYKTKGWDVFDTRIPNLPYLIAVFVVVCVLLYVKTDFFLLNISTDSHRTQVPYSLCITTRTTLKGLHLHLHYWQI